MFSSPFPSSLSLESSPGRQMTFVNGSNRLGHFQAACHTPSLLIGTGTTSCDKNLNLKFVHANLPLP